MKNRKVTEARFPTSFPVAAFDLGLDVQRWMGKEGLQYYHSVECDVWVLPDVNKDTVKRMSILRGERFRVVESEVPAMVFGAVSMGRLEEKNQPMEMPGLSQLDWDKIELRLEEQLAAARLAGMSKKGLARGRELLMKKAREVWRIKLQKGDVSSLPPLKLELATGEFKLPKPYQRRYSPSEMDWWSVNVKRLVDAGIVRPSAARELSPSNLVAKLKDGKVLTNAFRMVVDERSLNKVLRDIHFPIPKLDEVVHQLVGATCFAKADNTDGYWQCALDEASIPLTAFSCPLGAFEHLRVPMGCKVSAAHFQRCMQGVLRDMLFKSVLQYIDDTLIYAKTEDELLDALEQYFGLLLRWNVKLHPGKFVFFAKELEWGGKTLSAAGLGPTQGRLDAVKGMAAPQTLDELMHFIYGVAWFRGHLPYFAEAAAPLYDLWNSALAPYKRKTSQNARKVALKDLPGWKGGGQAVFDSVKELMADAIKTAYFDPELQTCVFTDTIDEFWCLVITQCKPGTEKLPWDQQVGKHRPLVIESGRFRHAQLRWSTVEKEGFVIAVKALDYSHWLNGGHLPCKIFTDHRNLLALFDDEARPPTCSKSNRDKLTRWGLRMHGLNYTIHHIDGKNNHLADLGSRWGNRFARRRLEAQEAGQMGTMGMKRGLRGGPCPLLHCFTCGHGGRRSGYGAALKRVLRSPHPKVSDAVQGPDLDLKERLVMPSEMRLANRASLKASQDQYGKERPEGLKLSEEEPQLWVNVDGAVWVPKGDRPMQRALYVLAHQGISGHRGKDATLKRLAEEVFWPGMEDDVSHWRKHCLQCLKMTNGEFVARPLGTQLVAEYPGEVLMSDYIKMGSSRSGFEYVLMLVDKFSRFVMFIPCAVATAVISARGIMLWASVLGLPL